MTKEQIINGLKHCIERPSHCNGCPYYQGHIKGDECRYELMRKAIILLEKENEDIY